MPYDQFIIGLSSLMFLFTAIGKGCYKWIGGGVLVSAVLVVVVAIVWGLLTTPAHPPPGIV